MSPAYAPPDVLWQINVAGWIEGGAVGMLFALALLAVFGRAALSEVQVPSGPMPLDLPSLTTADVRWSPPAGRAWREVVTIGADGTELGRAPIGADRVVHVRLPADYLGRYEVHLHSADGARAVAVEGRRLPPLEGS